MNSAIKYILLILFILTGSVFWLNSAFAAKPIKITVAGVNPNSALQGTALDAVISGSGFGPGSTVKFLVSGTNNDAQVEITGAVTYDEVTGDLTAPILVLGSAIIDYYDVEVRVLSGRRGKGTDLFRLQQNDGSESRSEKGTTECNDGLDNDGDGKIDGEDEDCFGSAKPDRDNTGRGKDLPLIAILDPDSAGNNLQNDDGGPYVHGEKHVKALAGDPLPPRIRVATGGGGKNIREVHIMLQCTGIPESSEGNDDIDNCEALGEHGVFDFTGGYILRGLHANDRRLRISCATWHSVSA